MLLFVFFALISYTPSFEARKVMREEKRDALHLEDSSTQILLPKDQYSSVLPPFPQEKGHAVATNVKLLTSTAVEIDRLLQSVPSPGIGN